MNNLKSISREEDQWKGERFEYDDANQLKSASYRVEVGPHDAPQGGPAPGPAETADVAEVPKDSAQEAVAAQEPDPVREPLAGGDAPDSQTGPRTVTYLNDAITRKSMSMNNNGTVTTTTYTPNKLNQYTAVTGHNTPVYDANFDLKGYDGWTFVHDADKRLISVSGNGHSAQFVYDGLGRCVRRTIDTVTTVFTLDEWKPIVEWDSSGTHVAWNLYGPGADEILTRYQYNTGGYVHYHLDAMGNVQFLMSADNLGLEKYTYDAFGKPAITTWDGAPLAFSQFGNRFMFTGREYLYTFGIYDYRHRHYHPGLGRFLQTDPIGFKGDAMNLYRYCAGNPINHSDPTGLIDSNNFDPNTPDYTWAQGADLSRYSAYFTYGGHGGEHDYNFGQVMNPRYRSSSVAIPVNAVIASIKGKALFAQKSGTLLLVCHSGEKGSTLARSVAMGTGKDVLAPNKYLWLLNQKDHPFVVAGGYRDGRTGELKMNTKDPGHLTRFLPNGTSRAGADFQLSQKDANGAIPVGGSGVDRRSSGPTAAEVDAAYQATGVPSLGAESVNRYNGVL